MKIKSGSFLKGLGAGLAVGCAVTMVMDPISDKQRRKIQRRTEGVFKSIGGIIDTAIDMF